VTLALKEEPSFLFLFAARNWRTSLKTIYSKCVNDVIYSKSYVTLIHSKVATFTLRKYKQIKNMLKIINDLPDNVLGVSGEGKITGKDYETVLIPAIAEKFKAIKNSGCFIILESTYRI